MFFHYFLHYCQPQPGAFAFGGHVGFKGARQRALGKTGPVVFDTQPDSPRCVVYSGLFAAARCMQRLLRVLQQVMDDLRKRVASPLT